MKTLRNYLVATCKNNILRDGKYGKRKRKFSPCTADRSITGPDGWEIKL